MHQILFLVLAYIVTLVYSTANNEDNSLKTSVIQGLVLFFGLVVITLLLAWGVHFLTPVSLS